MKKWLRSHWSIGITIISALVVTSVVLAVLGYLLKWDWTGLPEHAVPDPQKYQPAKTAWDWLSLFGVLAVPVVVGFGVAWYTVQQGQENERENTDNQRQASLQTYIDKMSDLLLEKNLRKSKEDSEERIIARARTLTVLKQLDPERKASVLRFLYEAHLVDKGKRIVNLKDADFQGTDLVYFRLKDADLSGAYLNEANLSLANLQGADLSNTGLIGARLSRTDLTNAVLKGAELFSAELPKAILKNADLEGAMLVHAELSDANLSDANMLNTILEDSDLTNADLSNAKMIRIRNCDLTGAKLSTAGIISIDKPSEATANLEGTLMGDLIAGMQDSGS